MMPGSWAIDLKVFENCPWKNWESIWRELSF
jgi:hypothetical protein